MTNASSALWSSWPAAVNNNLIS